ncbi:DUF6402 family protein [Photorhabdus tasmaniensis]|uniref:DUF6402 family protein n=1 Tax=Photorhabdus tasmaniensis TaxID=1004159 RepID=UPI004042FCE9
MLMKYQSTIRNGGVKYLSIFINFSVVNFIKLGSKFDTINDWHDAMGNSNMKVSVRGYVDKLSSKNVLYIQAIMDMKVLI